MSAALWLAVWYLSLGFIAAVLGAINALRNLKRDGVLDADGGAKARDALMLLIPKITLIWPMIIIVAIVERIALGRKP